MAIPNTIPEWDKNEVNIVEVDQQHKDEGWLAPAGIPEKPPFQSFNWWQNLVYKWIKYLNDEVIRIIDTKTSMISVDLPAGSTVKTRGFSAVSDGGGATYRVLSSYGGTIDERHAITLNNGNIAVVLPINNTIDIKQVGSTGVENENVATALGAAVRSGASNITVSQKEVTITSNIDLGGKKLIGNGTTYSGAFITNGTLDKVYKTATIVRDGEAWEYDIGRAYEKLIVKRAQTDNAVTSPFSECYSIISLTTSGKIARFDLVNGVGGSGVNDAGVTWDRLRVVNSYVHTGGFAITRVPTAQSAGVTTSDLRLSSYLSPIDNAWAPDGNTDDFAYSVPIGDDITFTVNGNVSTKGNLLFLTSTGSTDSIVVTINGVTVPAIAPKELVSGNHLRLISIDLDKNVNNVINISNTGASGFCYVFGANFYEVGDLPTTSNPSAGFYDTLILGVFTPVLYSGTGASIDTVMIDGSGTFVGSYHGGDVASEMLLQIVAPKVIKKIGIETSATTASNAIAVGDILTCKNITLRYTGTLKANVDASIRLLTDFGLDGAVDVRGYYEASVANLTIKTLYTGMHSTDRDLYLSNATTFNPATPTESFYSFGKEWSPLIQAGANNQHIAILPQFFEEGKSQRNQQLWDNANYIKYYYCPIQGVDTVLPSGERYPFACRYVYGGSLI